MISIPQLLRRHRERIARLDARWTEIERLTRDARRKPPEAGLAVPAIPPRGPMPLQGGAEAPLEFD